MKRFLSMPMIHKANGPFSFLFGPTNQRMTAIDNVIVVMASKVQVHNWNDARYLSVTVTTATLY